MYVTRPLSHFKKFPDALSESPEGPNSGFLVIQDEESETYSCFGLCKNKSLKDLPFPQNKKLTVQYVQSSGQSTYVSQDDVVFIPVLNLPLSSNRYYAITQHGKHKGEALTCSREEDMKTCCFCRCIKDIKPRPLDPQNVYQQVQIDNYEATCVGKGYFKGKSVAHDGFSPYVLRRGGWSIRAKAPRNYRLDDAPGINTALRARLPEFDFPLSYKSSEITLVGKWYTPFTFVRDGTLKYQIGNSVFYQITLEQRWEQIYTCQNNYNEGKSVHVDVTLDRESAYVFGNKATWDDKNINDGMILFTSSGRVGEETSVGLRVEVFQRMKWEQERAGWSGGKERQEGVTRVEQFGGNDGLWSRFGCYVLVESFVVRRMDGTLVLAYDFRHTHQIRSKWE